MASFWRNLRDTWRYRRVYATVPAALRTLVLRRRAAWQAAARESPDRVPLALAELGQPVVIRPATADFLVLHEVFELREYQPAERWNLRDDAVVVDLGANIGLATLYLQRLAPRGRFVAVEPDQENRRLLEINCAALIQAGQLHVLGAFVAEADGMAGIDRAGGTWGYRKADAPKEGESIRCLSVPTLMRECGLDRIDLLKCDVEGTEAALFGTCGNWIGAVQRLIVETHGTYRLAELYTDLRRNGWDFRVLADRQQSKRGICFLEKHGHTGSLHG